MTELQLSGLELMLADIEDKKRIIDDTLDDEEAMETINNEEKNKLILLLGDLSTVIDTLTDLIEDTDHS